MEDFECTSNSSGVNILSLPDEILDTLFSYTDYDEVSRLRLVSKKFDASAQRVLNQGFYKVEKYHAQCLRKVKEQLPRRESERRKHPLSVHCDILTSIETRLSLLGMTFMKYVELKYCCFIPGKVLDEMFKILRYVSTVSVPPRAHDILLELRDISSMAMEHFDEKIAPVFRAKSSSSPKLAVTNYGAFTEYCIDVRANDYLMFWMYQCSSARPSSCPQSSSTPLSRPAVPVITSGSSLEIAKLQLAVRQQGTKYLELKKENGDLKHKFVDYRRKLNELDRRLIEQNNILVQKNTRIVEQERKQTDEERKIIEQERKIVEQERKIMEQDRKIVELGRKLAQFTKTIPELIEAAIQRKNELAASGITSLGDLDELRSEINSAPLVSDDTTSIPLGTESKCNMPKKLTRMALAKLKLGNRSKVDDLAVNDQMETLREGAVTTRANRKRRLVIPHYGPEHVLPVMQNTIFRDPKVDEIVISSFPAKHRKKAPTKKKSR